MKKSGSILAIAILGLSTAFAQTKPATKKVKSETKVKTVNATSPTTTKKEVKKVEYATVKTTHLKKDGTPDLRYKANKTAKKKTKS